MALTIPNMSEEYDELWDQFICRFFMSFRTKHDELVANQFTLRKYVILKLRYKIENMLSYIYDIN